MEQLEQRRFQWLVAVRRAQVQDFSALAAKHRIHADLQLVDGEKLWRRTGHHKGQRILRHARGQGEWEKTEHTGAHRRSLPTPALGSQALMSSESSLPTPAKALT